MAFSETRLAALSRAHEWSRRQLKPFREQRAILYKLLAGNRYATGAEPERSHPVPFLKLLHQVLLRSLVASNPRYMMSTRVPELRPVAHAMEIAVNDRVKQTRLADALRGWVSDALVCMGILKVGVCYYPIEGTTGLIHDYMQTYVDTISLDDWVHDMTAKKWDAIGYAGHRVRMARSQLRMDPRLNPEQVDALPRATHNIYGEHGEAQTSSLSTSESLAEGEYDEMVDCWEMWLPREQMIGLFAAGTDGRLLAQQPLWSQAYNGPERGPFHLLRFGEIPDNILPCPPIMEMADMHIGLNGVYRKFVTRALNQKNIFAVQGNADEDAKRINDTPDGHAVRVDIGMPQEVAFGADNQMNVAAIARLQHDGSYYAGNLESLAGLGVQSETLGQDKLLHGAASKNIAAMQDQVVEATRDVGHDLAWYWWLEPQNYQVEVPIDGFPGESIPETITPEMREGNWLNLNFEMDPYSLQSESPGSRVQDIDQLMGIMGQMAPLMQGQNIAPNFAEYLRIRAHLKNMPDIERLVMFSTPPENQELQEAPRSPAATSRTYNRVSSSQASPAGVNNAQMAAAQGAASPQQAAVGMGGGA